MGSSVPIAATTTSQRGNSWANDMRVTVLGTGAQLAPRAAGPGRTIGRPTICACARSVLSSSHKLMAGLTGAYCRSSADE